MNSSFAPNVSRIRFNLAKLMSSTSVNVIADFTRTILYTYPPVIIFDSKIKLIYDKTMLGSSKTYKLNKRKNFLNTYLFIGIHVATKFIIYPHYCNPNVFTFRSIIFLIGSNDL